MDNQENNTFVHDELPALVEIIGVSFRGASKVYYFAANGAVAKEGDNAIVETARGLEYGKVTLTNSEVKREELVLPLKNVVRIADKNDDMRYEANREKEKEAFDVCLKKIADHGLDMKLIDVEYTFDNSKLLFYFTSDDRVDFRELVKDLAGYFRTRIELRQIGIRDEAKIMGGLGICGRPFCCNTFLPDFVQVSIKMAKEQNLSLNSAKISGACGRLMCCLRYEYDTYQEELRHMPKMDSTVVTPDGIGKVVELKPLENTVKIMLSSDNEKTPKLYHLSLLKPFDKNAPVPETPAVAGKTAEKTPGASEKNKNVGRDRLESGRNDRRREDKRVNNASESPEGENDAHQNLNETNRNALKDNRINRKSRGKGRGEDSGSDKGAPCENRSQQKSPEKSEKPSEQENQAANMSDNRNRNTHNRNRQNNQKQSGVKNNEQKPRQNNAKDPGDLSEQKAEPAQKPIQKAESYGHKEDDNKPHKVYAPLPSNSIKKNGKRKF